MDILGILLTVLTYVLIGFGFAAGFALWRYTARNGTRKSEATVDDMVTEPTR